MTAQLRAWADDGSALLASIVLPAAVSGSAGLAIAFRLQNDGDAVAPAPAVTFLQRDPASGAYRSSGLRAVDERWVEIQATGTTSSALGQPPTGWEPIGRGRWLERLTRLEAGEWHELEARYNPPGTAGEQEIEVAFDAEPDSRVLPVDQGHHEAGDVGTLHGLGDGTWSQLLVGAPLAASSPAGASVEVPDLAWDRAGVRGSRLAAQEALDNLDGSAAALAVGEAYVARLAITANGFEILKGEKDSVGSAVAPPLPSSLDVDLGTVTRDEGGTVDPADVSSDPLVGLHHPTASGLNLLPGPGRDLLDNRLLRQESRSLVPLPGSTAGIHVWLHPDRSWSHTLTAAAPVARARLAYVFETDASSIDLAARVDHRELLPGPVLAELVFEGALVDTAVRRWVNPTGRTLYLRPWRGVLLVADVPGAGNAAGEVRLDVRLDNGAGGVATAFTSQATDDRRPGLELDAGADHDDLRRAAADPPILAENLAVPPFGVVEVELEVVTPFDVAGPEGLRLTLAFDRG